MREVQATRQAEIAALRARLDEKTKPRGSLGRLEDLAVPGRRRRRAALRCARRRSIVVVAGDHGVAARGRQRLPAGGHARRWSPNFAGGDAAIYVLARQAGARLVVVDAGVVEPVDDPGVLDLRRRRDGRTSPTGPAMSRRQAAARARGRHRRSPTELVRDARSGRARRDGHRQHHRGGGARRRAPRVRPAADVRPGHRARRRRARAQGGGRRGRRSRLNHPDPADPIGVLAAARRLRDRGARGSRARRAPRARCRSCSTASSAAPRRWPRRGSLRRCPPGSSRRTARRSRGTRSSSTRSASSRCSTSAAARRGLGRRAALPLIRASLAILEEMATFAGAGVTDAGR